MRERTDAASPGGGIGSSSSIWWQGQHGTATIATLSKSSEPVMQIMSGCCRRLNVALEIGMHEGTATMVGHDSRMEPGTLTRRQFDAFNEVGRAVRISNDARRRLLLMSPQEWSAWQAFVADAGALPTQPAIPVVLRRLANASYRLAARADRRPTPTQALN
jgi:hypothetical protein